MVSKLGSTILAMADLAVDLASGMTTNGVIADREYGLIVGEEVQDQAGKSTGQLKGRPLSRGKNPLVGGLVHHCFCNFRIAGGATAAGEARL